MRKTVLAAAMAISLAAGGTSLAGTGPETGPRTIKPHAELCYSLDALQLLLTYRQQGDTQAADKLFKDLACDHTVENPKPIFVMDREDKFVMYRYQGSNQALERWTLEDNIE